MKKLVGLVVVLFVLTYVGLKIWKFQRAFHASGIDTSQILKQAREKQNENREFVQKERAQGKSTAEIFNDLKTYNTENAHKKGEWLKMVCSRTTNRQLDERTVLARVNSRMGAIFLSEGVQNWSELLKKPKLQSDMTLAWLQNILFDLASIDALTDYPAKVSPQTIDSLKVYSKYLYDLSKKGIGPSWLSNSDEWLKIYNNPKDLITEIRDDWLQVKKGTCP